MLRAVLVFLVAAASVATGLAAGQARRLGQGASNLNLKGSEEFHPKRVHFVDRIGDNGFFRGNEPVANNSDTLSYDIVVAEIKKKVRQMSHRAGGWRGVGCLPRRGLARGAFSLARYLALPPTSASFLRW